MKKISNKKTKDFVLKFWERDDAEQVKISDEEMIAYSPYPIIFVITKKIFFLDFLFHPMLIKHRKFYEAAETVENEKKLFKDIETVLEYELISDQKTYLTIEERDNLIKYHKKLQSKFNKKYANE